jgi:hypothetical protein
VLRLELLEPDRSREPGGPRADDAYIHVVRRALDGRRVERFALLVRAPARGGV